MSANKPRSQYVSVGPRTFNLPPYERCPKCGATELGVLMILPRHYVRRCQACLHPVHLGLPALRKRIIYLDQFAISDMMKVLNPTSRANRTGNVPPRWLELFRKLDHLTKLQLIACPDSLFHRRESEASPFNDALRRLYELLSGGLTFEDAAYIEQYQVRQSLEQWLDGRLDHTFDLSAERVVHGEVHGWRERFIISVHLPTAAEDIERRRKTRGAFTGQLADLFRSWREEPLPFEARVAFEVQSYGETLLRMLAEYVQRYEQVLAGVPELNPEALLPPKAAMTFLVMRDVLSARGFADKEVIPKAKEYLASEAMGMIPFLSIRAKLFAALARQAAAGRKRLPDASLLTDTTMVSVLLPYCDAMLVDNEMAALAREAGVPANGMAGQMFCPKTIDAFIRYLDAIEGECTPEHRELVASVYGPRGTEPFDTLFTSAD